MPPVFYTPPVKDVSFRRTRRRALVLAALAAAFCALVALAYLRQYVLILGLNYDIARSKRQLEEARRERASLRADFYRKRSLKEIEEIAREQLHMQPPAPGQIILVEDK